MGGCVCGVLCVGELGGVHVGIDGEEGILCC